MKTMNISKQEYVKLKKRAGLNENLLIKLIKGLEDIRAGRIKPWKNQITH